ncbi:MAG: hypothetical protein ACYTG6_03715 [Planctomycetota bacterium]
MAVSAAVRRYYAERIFARTTREEAPPNFRPLGVPHTGFVTVEGCRGGGKNIVEIFLLGRDDRVEDVRCACGLCNPAMYACIDIVLDWARGRRFAEILAIDPLDVVQLVPFYDVLGGPGRPDDAREKFQYALLALQNAVRDHRKEPPRPIPEIAPPTDRDWAEDEP